MLRLLNYGPDDGQEHPYRINYQSQSRPDVRTQAMFDNNFVDKNLPVL